MTDLVRVFDDGGGIRFCVRVTEPEPLFEPNLLLMVPLFLDVLLLRELLILLTFLLVCLLTCVLPEIIGL